jgi:hypothetical protein
MEQQPDIVLSAIVQLEALSYDDLPHLVVELCVDSREEIAWQIRHFFLERWLKADGYHKRAEVIAYLLPRLRHSNGSRLVRAVKTAWVLGYRERALQAELKRIAGIPDQPRPGDEAQGYALAALAAMAYPDRGAVIRLLRSRAESSDSLTDADCWTALRVAPPDFIGRLRDAAASQPVAVDALLAISERHPDPETVSKVWEAFSSLDRRVKFGYTATATDLLDLAGVGSWLASDALAAFEGHPRGNVLPATTALLSANLPEHIRVFASAKSWLTPEQRSLLEVPALTATGNTGLWQTAESHRKEAAWNVILRLGLEEARTWLSTAMREEVNFVLDHLAAIASFLRIPEAVEPLATTISNPGVHIGIRVGGLRHLGILGTERALEALLRSNVRVEHSGKPEIPAALVEGMTSACMAMRSSRAVWKVLCDPDADPDVRRACAHTIEELSSLLEAPLPDSRDILTLVQQEGPALPGYHQLVRALARFREDAAVLSFLEALARTDESGEELTQALADTGLLVKFPERVERLGLRRRDDGRWELTGTLDEIGALALLCLYRADLSFEPAMEQLLGSDTFRPAVQVVANLRDTDRLSPVVQRALWDRVRRWNGPNLSDRSALEAAARVCPELLLEESTVVDVAGWSTAARRAYLAALRTILPNHSAAIAQIASDFLRDEDGEVRRDAARLARDADPVQLGAVAARLSAGSESLEEAVFALDAAFWLDDFEWKQYEAEGLSHKEPVVREHTRRLGRERQRAGLARRYLQEILNSHDYLNTWCYGQAIAQLGDEETIDRLTHQLPPEVHCRAYQFWLARQVSNQLERRRRDDAERTDLPPPDSQERPVEVTVNIAGERLGPFYGVLQESHRPRARKWVSSWFIQINDEPDLALRMIDQGNAQVWVETSDGRRGRVLPGDSYVDASGTAEAKARVRLLGQGELSPPAARD